jgi:predicted GNAT superfamily acetyltransferase
VTADPWELAHRAAAEAGVAVRVLTELDDARAVSDVIRATWGDWSVPPPEFIRALQASGNAPIGAVSLEDGSVMGFALGFLGPDEEGIHLHSHMLAVQPDRRSAGLGYALKLAQRAAALDAGVRVARWTFDPLQARNAYFNIAKLGTAADRFHRHFYGDMGDALNAGDRSDRLEARWELEAEPGRPRPELRDPFVVLGPGDGGRPSPVREPKGEPAAVWVPGDYASLRASDPESALAWRDAVAVAIEACLGAGLEATGFLREGAYVFTRGEP